MHLAPTWRKTIAGAAIAAGLAGAFYAGTAYAADPRLDQAKDNITKAIALLKAAENPGVKPEFGGHRMRAIAALERANNEIDQAKRYADKPRDKPGGKPPHGHPHPHPHWPPKKR
jgi:hypothetical protein